MLPFANFPSFSAPNSPSPCKLGSCSQSVNSSEIFEAKSDRLGSTLNRSADTRCSYVGHFTELDLPQGACWEVEWVQAQAGPPPLSGLGSSRALPLHKSRPFSFSLCTQATCHRRTSALSLSVCLPVRSFCVPEYLR